MIIIISIINITTTIIIIISIIIKGIKTILWSINILVITHIHCVLSMCIYVNSTKKPNIQPKNMKSFDKFGASKLGKNHAQ